MRKAASHFFIEVTRELEVLYRQVLALTTVLISSYLGIELEDRIDTREVGDKNKDEVGKEGNNDSNNAVGDRLFSKFDR